MEGTYTATLHSLSRANAGHQEVLVQLLLGRDANTGAKYAKGRTTFHGQEAEPQIACLWSGVQASRLRTTTCTLPLPFGTL